MVLQCPPVHALATMASAYVELLSLGGTLTDFEINLICNKKVSDSFDKISDSTNKFLKLGKKLLSVVPEQVEEAHSDDVEKRMGRW